MTTYPALMIGSGKTTVQVLAQTARLLRSFRSPVEHVLAIGTYEAGNIEKLHVPPVHLSEQFVNPFAEWMCRIRAERNLERARDAGIYVGPVGGYLLVQILLVVDSDRTESISAIVRMLEEAVLFLQEKIPPRLHLLMIHPYSSHLPASAIEGAAALVQSGTITPSSRWVAAPVRSDGSTLTEEDFRAALPYLLFAALQPTEHGEEHWLFRKPHSLGRDWLVPGFGLVVLPLPEIEDALTHQLLADAYSKLNGETEVLPEAVPDLEPEETTWWRCLLQAVPHVAVAGAGLTLSLLHDQPHLSKDPRRWLQEADEWDAHWRKEVLPQNEQALQSAADGMLEAFRSYLGQYVRNSMLASQCALPLLHWALSRAVQAMDRWVILKMDLSDEAGETIHSARVRFEKALAQLPERGKLIPIAALITFVSWAVLQSALWLLAPRLGGYLWWAVAAMAVLPPVAVGWGTYAFYRWRETYLQQCWNDYLKHLQAQHAELLRCRALRVLQNAAQEMKDVITSELQRVQSLQQDISARVSLWKQLAQALRIAASSPIRPIISHWRHIQPMVEELWGKRDLSQVVRRGLEELGIGTLADLQDRIDDLSRHLRRQLLEHWMTAEHRQPSYYLRLRFGSEEVLSQWLRQQMKEAAQEASALLWRCERPAYQGWRLLEADLPMVDGLAPGVPRGDKVLVVSNVFGRVCMGKTTIQ